MNHLGDPCIHCGNPHDHVSPGQCEQSQTLGAKVRNIQFLSGLLKTHEEGAAKETARLKNLIAHEKTVMLQLGGGLDRDKIELAESVMRVSRFSNGGDEKEGARQDAIKWFATGKGGYQSLREGFYGTKNYDRWSGQRCDCEYGMGPRHGSICFSIGLTSEARRRDLTEDEKEACIYYLLNLAAIQDAQVNA